MRLVTKNLDKHTLYQIAQAYNGDTLEEESNYEVRIDYTKGGQVYGLYLKPQYFNVFEIRLDNDGVNMPGTRIGVSQSAAFGKMIELGLFEIVEKPSEEFNPVELLSAFNVGEKFTWEEFVESNDDAFYELGAQSESIGNALDSLIESGHISSDCHKYNPIYTRLK